MPRTPPAKEKRISGKQWYQGRRRRGHKPQTSLEKRLEGALLSEDLANDPKLRQFKD